MNSQEGGPVAVGNAILPLTHDLSSLFGEHNRRVLMSAYRITGNMADAEDVTQAVFLRLASTNAPVANAGSYLYRAAINGALDLLRKRASAAAEPLEEAASMASAEARSSPERTVANRELSDLVREAIAELPARAAEMFTLRYLEEMDNREIAQWFGTSQAVVAVTLHQARSRLKKRLYGIESGKTMRQDEVLFESAIEAIHADRPDFGSAFRIGGSRGRAPGPGPRSSRAEQRSGDVRRRAPAILVARCWCCS